GDLRIQESIQHRLDQFTQEARVIDQRLTRNHRQSHILQMSHRPLRSQWVTAVSHLGGAMAPSLPAAAQGPGRTRFTEGTGRNLPKGQTSIFGSSRPESVNEKVNPLEASSGSRTVMKTTSPCTNSYARPLSTSRSNALRENATRVSSAATPAMMCALPSRSAGWVIPAACAARRNSPYGSLATTCASSTSVSGSLRFAATTDRIAILASDRHEDLRPVSADLLKQWAKARQRSTDNGVERATKGNTQARDGRRRAANLDVRSARVKPPHSSRQVRIGMSTPSVCTPSWRCVFQCTSSCEVGPRGGSDPVMGSRTAPTPLAVVFSPATRAIASTQVIAHAGSAP